MKTAVRIDDITIHMDWERFRRIEAILDEAGIKPLIGVVPFPEDPNLDRMGKDFPLGPRTAVPMEEWPESLKKGIPEDDKAYTEFLNGLTDKGWMIAMHGYKHVYTTKKRGIFPLNPFSEFAGVSYFDQLNMIKSGADRMRELKIETEFFMAPGHTYDKNTLKALTAMGFTRITDGFGKRPYARIVHNVGKTEVLKFYPICIRTSDTTSKKKDGFTTMVLHCNTMSDADIEAFKKTVTEHRDCFIDYSEYIIEGAVNRFFIGNCLEYATAILKNIFVKARALVHIDADSIKASARAIAVGDDEAVDEDEFGDWVK